MDLILRSFRFKSYDYPQTVNFYHRFQQMNINHQFLSSFKVVIGFVCGNDDVALRFEFPRIPSTNVYDMNGHLKEVTDGLYTLETSSVPYMNVFHKLMGNNNEEKPDYSVDMTTASRTPPFGLLASPYGPVYTPMDPTSITLYTDNLNDLIERGKSLGIKEYSERINLDQCFSCAFLDPNGILVQVVQLKDENIKEKEMLDIDTHQLKTSNQRQAYVTVYCNTLQEYLNNQAFYDSFTQKHNMWEQTAAKHSGKMAGINPNAPTSRVSASTTSIVNSASSQGSFRAVDSDRDNISLQKMSWLGNEQRHKGATLHLLYNGRLAYDVSQTEPVVVTNVTAQFPPLQVPSSVLQSELTKKHTWSVNALERSTDLDGAQTCQQSMYPRLGHCVFLGIGFTVSNQGRSQQHLQTLYENAEALAVHHIPNQQRYILLEDEAGIPIEQTDGTS